MLTMDEFLSVKDDVSELLRLTRELLARDTEQADEEFHLGRAEAFQEVLDLFEEFADLEEAA